MSNFEIICPKFTDTYTVKISRGNSRSRGVREAKTVMNVLWTRYSIISLYFKKQRVFYLCYHLNVNEYNSVYLNIISSLGKTSQSVFTVQKGSSWRMKNAPIFTANIFKTIYNNYKAGFLTTLNSGILPTFYRWLSTVKDAVKLPCFLIFGGFSCLSQPLRSSARP